MKIGIIDILLLLSLLYLIVSIISNYNNNPSEVSNIIFDDDVIIINSGNENLLVSNSKDDSKLDNTKPNLDNTKPNLDNTKPNIDNTKSNIDNTKSNFESLNYDKLTKDIMSDINPLDTMVLDGIITKSDLNIKNTDKLSNRYNRKLNNVPTESDLNNIRNSEIKNDDLLSTDNLYDLDIINNHNMNILQKNNSLDSKYFNKSNKSQKLFKDAKTIAGRFTKNSINDDYKYELDYYEKLRTPWWAEDSKFDY